MTTSALSPAWDGKRWARRCWARCDAELPDAKLSLKALPATRDSPITAMTITIAAASAEQKSATKDVLGLYCVLRDTKEDEIRVLQDTVEALQIELARNGARRTRSSSQEGVS